MAVITSLFAWVGVDEQGREGIVVIPRSNEPAIRRKLEAARRLEPVMRAIAEADGRPIRLVAFRRGRVARVVGLRRPARSGHVRPADASVAPGTGERTS